MRRGKTRTLGDMKPTPMLLAAAFALGSQSLLGQEAVIVTSEFFLMVTDPCETVDSQGPTWCKKLFFRIVRRSDCREFRPKGKPDIRYCARTSPDEDPPPCEDVGYTFFHRGLTYRTRRDGMHVSDKSGNHIRTEATNVVVTRSPTPSFQLIGNKCALAGVDFGSEVQAGLLGAIQGNDVGAVQKSLQQGAKVNAQNENGWTPVLLASMTRGSAETIRLLVSQGAELTARDPFGRTPLILAAWSEDKDVLRLLVDAGADVNATDKKGESALIAAARRGNSEQVMSLLRSGAAVDYEDPQGRTALSYAFEAHRYGSGAEPDHWGCVRLLLGAGASLEKRDSRGITPFRHITDSGHCAPVDIGLVQTIASKVPATDVKEVETWASNRRSEPKNCDVLAEALKNAQPR
jgi:hypothetical protein